VRLVDEAIGDPQWSTMATLDAALRMIAPIVGTAGLPDGNAAVRLLDEFLERVRVAPEHAFEVIPPQHWSVLPMQGSSEQEPQLCFRGAVLVRVRGRRPACAARNGHPKLELGPEDTLSQRLGLTATTPLRQLLNFLRADGVLAPLAVAGALMLSAGGVVFEALLYRTFLDLTGMLGLAEQRLGALGMLLGFLGLLLVLDLQIGGALLRLGRRLEARLRMYLLQKLPKLPDRYFGSRLISDMAERGHAMHEIRMLPVLGGQLVHHSFELVLTTAGIIWLDPATAPIAVAAALGAVALPFLAQPVLEQRDLRFRTHSGGLARFYFDSLRGLMPVRAHGAEEAVKTEHEAHLVRWSRSGFSLQRSAVLLEGITLLFGTFWTASLLLSHIGRHADSTVALLLIYWALNLPVIGRYLAEAALLYPRIKNLSLRLLEPLAFPEKPEEHAEPSTSTALASHSTSLQPARIDSPGLAIAFQNVSVRAIGQTILEDVSLSIEAGTHLCIVGPSGAGKSSLVGLLLGWHRPAAGSVLVDGSPLHEARRPRIRKETTWVDPSIQIWNRSLLENLQYGTQPEDSSPPIGQIISEADLLPVLEKLPDGLQTRLGEAGALVSGGEGQRVRLGRAMLRRSPRLVILDEPFTSLDRTRRRELLRRAKRIWRGSTLLYVTHDVSEGSYFDRVVVLEQGRLREDGRPEKLLSQENSLYRRMLESEQAARRDVWASKAWRKLRLDDGRAVESAVATIEKPHDDERPAHDLLAGRAAR
jgi:ATP-binding cassette subfamily B protein